MAPALKTMSNKPKWMYRSPEQRQAALRRHLFVFLIVNTGLFTLNMLRGHQTLWAVWPLCGWGAGVVLHGSLVFLRNRRDAQRDTNSNNHVSEDGPGLSDQCPPPRAHTDGDIMPQRRGYRTTSGTRQRSWTSARINQPRMPFGQSLRANRSGKTKAARPPTPDQPPSSHSGLPDRKQLATFHLELPA